MLTQSRSFSTSLGAFSALQEPLSRSLDHPDADFQSHRKQFSPSDFSRTLRDLGLTPSAVSPCLLFAPGVYDLCTTWHVFTIVGLDSVVRNICYKLFISLYFLFIVLKHGHGCTVRNHISLPGHVCLQENALQDKAVGSMKRKGIYLATSSVLAKKENIPSALPSLDRSFFLKRPKNRSQ